MALKEYFGENRYDILNKVEPLVSEFEKLPKVKKLEVVLEKWKHKK